MLSDLAIRFVLGGIIVCAFSVIGEMLHPKSFAGIFGAAPSVALASLGLAFAIRGARIASVDGHAMMLGAIGMCVYCMLVARLLLHNRWNTFAATASSWLVWAIVAFGLRAATLR